jgi:hypothetical protein
MRVLVCLKPTRRIVVAPILVPGRVPAVLSAHRCGADLKVVVKALVVPGIVAFQSTGSVHHVRVDVVIAGR